MADTITGVEVRLVADLGDGNDPHEWTESLPFLPRKGDELAIWVSNEFAPGPEFFTVTNVVVNTWDGSVDVAVSTDGHTDDSVRSAFEALKRGDHP